ncbi:MAG: hypothetical protein RLZZ70_64 [Candidatus Parcubacteria bacterium]|jgi:hypothetical protein
MEQIPTDQNELVISLLRENQGLLRQNNELLHKHERRERRRLIFKIVWYTILLGIPMLAYYYLYSTFLGLMGLEGGNTTNNEMTIPPTVLEGLIEAYISQ